MKWLKRILLCVAVLLTVVIVAASIGVYMYRGRPGWYRPRTMTASQRKQTVNSADQKFADIFSWAAQVQAQQLRISHAKRPIREAPIGPKTVTITEDELNTFADNWQGPDKSNLQSWFKGYFTDVRLVLDDGAMILAGQSRDLGTLVSVEFDPSVDVQGRLHFDLEGIRAGMLPVPRGVLGDRLDRLHSWLVSRLSKNQQWSEVDPTMVADTCAVGAVTTQLLLDAMDGNTSEPLMFVPFNLSDRRQSLTVRISAIKASQGSITLTLLPIPVTERTAVLTTIKKPYGQPAAAAQ
ncbi:MAG: hypothetical protein M3O30_00290 [Planctomycetota bacterium]|nr:hypothetical protein [Planctomycetota bacterium]